MTNNICQQWNEMLSRYKWDYKLDLTSRYPIGTESIARECRHLHRILTRCTQGPVDAFFALERSSGGLWHVHALIGSRNPLSQDRLKAIWRTGYQRVQRIRDPRSAIRYAVKSAATSTEHFHLALSKHWRGKFDAS